MPIIYAVVSRGETVLARYATCSGNFQEVTDQVFKQITKDEPRLTFTHNSFLFHYICEDDLIYMCITDDEFPRSHAFLFLEEIKKKFTKMYGTRALSAIPFAMNGEFSSVLRSQMALFSEDKNVDKVARLDGEVKDLEKIVVKNIEYVAMRGERLELLLNKAENLSANAVSFRQSSHILQRSLFWKNIKYYVIFAAIVILVIYFVVSMFCGGLSWSSCVG